MFLLLLGIHFPIFVAHFFVHNLLKSEKLPTQENQHKESLGMTGQKIVIHLSAGDGRI